MGPGRDRAHLRVIKDARDLVAHVRAPGIARRERQIGAVRRAVGHARGARVVDLRGVGVGAVGPPRLPKVVPKVVVSTLAGASSGVLIDISGASDVACGKAVVDP